MFVLDDEKLPLQLYQFGSDSFECQCVAPAGELSPFINYYWWLEVANGTHELEVIPDNATDLVMSPCLSGMSILYLPVLEKFSIPLTGPITYVGISFRSARTPEFFGVSTSELRALSGGTDTRVLLGIETLVDSVQALQSADQLAGVLDQSVLNHLATPRQPVKSGYRLDLEKVLDAMHTSIGVEGMQAVSSHLELSERQFRRIMTSCFGFSPKKVQRVMRLQASLRGLLNPYHPAEDDGFHDDAHRIKEIQALTGLTPGKISQMAEIYNRSD